jgi:hypothetical protein
VTPRRVMPWAVGAGLLAVVLTSFPGTWESPTDVPTAEGSSKGLGPPPTSRAPTALAAPLAGRPVLEEPNPSLAADASKGEVGGDRGSSLEAQRAILDAEAWQRIPLDSGAGESLGDYGTRHAFSRAMRQPPALGSCTGGWSAPPGLRHVEVKTELRVRSEGDSLVVEDALIREANVSDSDLEACLVSQLRGRRIPAPGTRPGQAFRIEWSSIKSLR